MAGCSLSIEKPPSFWHALRLDTADMPKRTASIEAKPKIVLYILRALRPRITQSKLPRDDSGCQEEQQLLRLDRHGCPFEKVSNQRQAADERNL